MKIISLFNNKGGVGKSTLGFHLGYALNEMGHKTLFIDLDPQCNLTLNGMDIEEIHSIWEEEDRYIEEFQSAYKEDPKKILTTPRSIHFLLKPTEDGESDLTTLPPPVKLDENLDLIPGRLSIHRYENKLAERWNGAYQGDNLAIRTITKIRELCNQYARQYGYEYIIIDTSPSLGILNKTIISTVDGFFIPAQPDMFSLYGIRNIGNSLQLWKKEFETIYNLISTSKRENFPQKFVQFLGFTIYGAKKYATTNNPYDLADAHYSYVLKIPEFIKDYIKRENREFLDEEMLIEPIGKTAVMHTHNTFPSMAQALHVPMWRVPDEFEKKKIQDQEYLEINHIDINSANYGRYRVMRDKYKSFAEDFLHRVEKLNGDH
ncbi:MAG: AAA family ATPase [Sulfurovum sp.]|nr:AAA family ATPase [Sulfurovum sp.]